MLSDKRSFDPNAGDATLVCVADGQGVSNPDYKSELEAYLAFKDTDRLMRERSSVCG